MGRSIIFKQYWLVVLEFFVVAAPTSVYIAPNYSELTENFVLSVCPLSYVALHDGDKSTYADSCIQRPLALLMHSQPNTTLFGQIKKKKLVLKSLTLCDERFSHAQIMLKHAGTN